MKNENLMEATKKSFTLLILTTVSMFAGAAIWAEEATPAEYKHVLLLITAIFASLTVIMFIYYYDKGAYDRDED